MNEDNLKGADALEQHQAKVEADDPSRRRTTGGACLGREMLDP